MPEKDLADLLNVEEKSAEILHDAGIHSVEQLTRISHQDHGSRRRIRVRKRRSGAKSVAIATV